jgi:hypothetical protein
MPARRWYAEDPFLTFRPIPAADLIKAQGFTMAVVIIAGVALTTILLTHFGRRAALAPRELGSMSASWVGANRAAERYEG